MELKNEYNLPIKNATPFAFYFNRPFLYLTFLLLAFSAQKSIAQYCMPSYGTVCIQPGVNDFIDDFWTTGGITNITNMNSSCNMQPNNYIYYSNMNVTVNPGSSFGVNMQCGTTFPQGFVIWIDWNNDFAFSALEEVYNSGTAGFQVFSGTINVPSNFICDTLRMRIRCNPSRVNRNPCNNQTFGECEDYNLIINYTPPAITTSSTDASCGLSNGTATVNESGYIYSWAPSGQFTQTAYLLGPGTYTVTVTVPGVSCPPVQATVTVHNAGIFPTVNVNNDTICAGQSATLTATPSGSGAGGHYAWVPTLDTTQSITVSPTVTTTYYVVYRVDGCLNPGLDSATVIVNPGTAPTVTVNNQTICQGQNAILTATPSAAGGTYAWSPGGQTTQSITVSPASTTTYSVVYTLGACSSNSSSGKVTVNPFPVMSITPSSPFLCTGSSVSLTASGAGAYSWSPGTGLSATIGATVTATPSATTTYIVTGTTNGCSNTDTVTVTVNPLLAISITPASSSICTGTSVSLTASGANTYSWSPNTGLSATTGNTINAGPSATTTYTVSGTANGCTNTATVTITVNPLPVVSVTPPTPSICTGDTVDLTASGAIHYIWSPGTGLSTTIGDTVNATPSATTTYTVTGTDAAGCRDTATVTITLNNIPIVADFSANPTVSFTNENIAFTDWSTGATMWHWSFGDGNSASIQNPLHSYQLPGMYIVGLVIKNNEGCIDSTSLSVEIMEDFMIPNVFSPNGDGMNDVFEIKVGGALELSLTVFNRFGRKVHEITGPKIAWDGRTPSGETISDGTYFYTLDVVFNTGSPQSFQGFIQSLK